MGRSQPIELLGAVPASGKANPHSATSAPRRLRREC